MVTLDCALAMKAYDEIDILDFQEKGHREIPGYKMFQEKEVDLEEFITSYEGVIVATGNNDLREKKLGVLESMGISPVSVIHPTAVISPMARISAGCTILACAVVNANAFVGAGCTLIDDIAVGEEVVIGAGAVVIRDVPDRVVAVGVPAKGIR